MKGTTIGSGWIVTYKKIIVILVMSYFSYTAVILTIDTTLSEINVMDGWIASMPVTFIGHFGPFLQAFASKPMQ